MVKRISVLGSTGSVGTQTLDLVKQQPEQFKVIALTAQNNADKLIEQARQFQPECVAIENAEQGKIVGESLSGLPIDVLIGDEGVCAAASRPADWVMAAITGAAGLKPIWKAVQQGANIALANKEALVCAGPLLLDEIKKTGKALLPVDSEHNAIFQVLCGQDAAQVKRLILTASGGPFRETPMAELQNVKLEDALKHPTWQMGQKISIDSATMMNKGLELIEACYLFSKQESDIDIVIHPQSIVHSLVEFNDGSVLAQMGASDMRIPIAHCLAWPARMTAETKKLNWNESFSFDFMPPDVERFPALQLARAAMRSGAATCIVFNAANEMAVSAFVKGQISFLNIVQIAEDMMGKLQNETSNQALCGLEDVLEMDRMTRAKTAEHLKRMI